MACAGCRAMFVAPAADAGVALWERAPWTGPRPNVPFRARRENLVRFRAQLGWEQEQETIMDEGTGLNAAANAGGRP